MYDFLSPQSGSVLSFSSTSDSAVEILHCKMWERNRMQIKEKVPKFIKNAEIKKEGSGKHKDLVRSGEETGLLAGWDEWESRPGGAGVCAVMLVLHERAENDLTPPRCLLRTWKRRLTARRQRRRCWVKRRRYLRRRRKTCPSTSSPSLLPPTSREFPLTRTSEERWNNRCFSMKTKGTSWCDWRLLWARCCSLSSPLFIKSLFEYRVSCSLSLLASQVSRSHRFHKYKLALLSCRRRWQCGSLCWGSWGTCQSPNVRWSSTTAAKRSPSWPRSTKRWGRGLTRGSCRSCRWRERWADSSNGHDLQAVYEKTKTYLTCLCLQNSSVETQKRNSVRHKLVSLTLKRKSKITEEVILLFVDCPAAWTHQSPVLLCLHLFLNTAKRRK